MAITAEIRGNFDRQDGADGVSGTLIFTLSGRDFDGSILIEPAQQTVELDAEGAFQGLRLWPNDRGRMNTTYRVEYLTGGSAKREVIEAQLFVPETGGPHDLADLILANDVARQSQIERIIPITAEEFAERQSGGSLKDALYLIEGALE